MGFRFGPAASGSDWRTEPGGRVLPRVYALPTLCIPFPISLFSSPFLGLPTRLSQPHLHPHLTAVYLTGLETCSRPPQRAFPTLSLSCPSYPVFLQSGVISLHCKSDLITPILDPSWSPTALRIKSHFLTCSQSLGSSLIFSLNSRRTKFPAPPPTLFYSLLSVSVPLSTVSPGKSPSLPLLTLELLLILHDVTQKLFPLCSPPQCWGS